MVFTEFIQYFWKIPMVTENPKIVNAFEQSQARLWAAIKNTIETYRWLHQMIEDFQFKMLYAKWHKHVSGIVLS